MNSIKKITYFLFIIVMVLIGGYFLIDYENTSSDVVDTYYVVDNKKTDSKTGNDKKIKYLTENQDGDGTISFNTGTSESNASIGSGTNGGTFTTEGDSGSLAVKSNNGPGDMPTNPNYTTTQDDSDPSDSSASKSDSSASKSDTSPSKEDKDQSTTGSGNTFGPAQWAERNGFQYEVQSKTGPFGSLLTPGNDPDNTIGNKGCMWFACSAAISKATNSKVGVEALLSKYTTITYTGSSYSWNPPLPCVGMAGQYNPKNICAQFGVQLGDDTAGWPSNAGYYIIYTKSNSHHAGGHWVFGKMTSSGTFLCSNDKAGQYTKGTFGTVGHCFEVKRIQLN